MKYFFSLFFLASIILVILFNPIKNLWQLNKNNNLNKSKRNAFTNSKREISKSNGNTYENKKYKFTINYPSTWNYIDIYLSEYNNNNNEIWFSSHPIKTIIPHMFVDIRFVFTKYDPTVFIKSQYPSQYEFKPYQLGNISAQIITGETFKSNVSQTIIIAPIGDYHIQIYGYEGSQNWNKILNTFLFKN